MRYIYSVLWLGFFSVLAYFVYTGSYADYAGRKGKFFANLLDVFVGAVGHLGAAAIIMLIGLGVAYWASKPDKEDKLSNN
jgi:hypothetical protein